MSQQSTPLDARAQELIRERIRKERGTGWVEVEPRPAGPGEVQILRHWVYVGPTLNDLPRRG